MRSPDEVAEDLFAFLREHGLGMELDAVGRVPCMAQAHDGAVGGPCGDDELCWKRSPLDDQRVISGRLERIGDAGQHARVVVADPRGLAVRWFVADDAGAEGLAQALVAEADAGDRDVSGQVPNRLVGDACIIRGAGAGRDHDAVVAGQLRDCDLVVAEDRRLHPELTEVLHEVVRERVVVVDYGQLGRAAVDHHNSSAISTALNMAPAFSSVSSNSRSGFESATTPAPACTYASPPATTMVRSVIAMSRLPPKLT